MGLTGTSCINDASDCPLKDGEGSEYVTFSFDMVPTNIGKTRAVDTGGHDETTSEWPAFENSIEEEDFAFYIFVKDKSDEWRSVMSMTDLRYNQDANLTMTDVSGLWSITAAIHKTVFEEIIGYNIDSDIRKNIELRVAVVANASGGDISKGNRFNYYSLIGKTFAQFIENANNKLLFNLQSLLIENSENSNISDIYRRNSYVWNDAIYCIF